MGGQRAAVAELRKINAEVAAAEAKQVAEPDPNDLANWSDARVQLEEFETDPGNIAALLNSDHPKHRLAMAQRSALSAEAFPSEPGAVPATSPIGETSTPFGDTNV